MKHKCSGIPCYISKKEAIKIIIKVLENDEASISVLEWAMDSIFGNIHIVSE